MKKPVVMLVGMGLLAGMSFTDFSRMKVSAQVLRSEAKVEPNRNDAPVSGWMTSCMASERNNPLTCVLEQSVFVPGTSQQLVNVKIQVELKQEATLLITAPLGIFLPAGISIRVDRAEPRKLDVQTCDAVGCYAAEPVADELIEAMKAGSEFSVAFQNLAGEEISVAMPLQEFSDGLAKVR